jgi:hypothetical protein
MKTNKNVLIVIGLLIGFVAGLIVGMYFLNPGLNPGDAAGTIGKVDKYRNVKITEADIELQNELLADEQLRQAFVNYMQYEYAAAVKMSEDIRFALSVSDETPAFQNRNQRMVESMIKYNSLLENARLYLFEAAMTVEDLDSKDKIAIGAVLNNANNALTQIRQGNVAVYDFLSAAENFFNEGERGSFPKLEDAYGRLFSNLLASSIITNNRMAFEYLISKNTKYDQTSTAKLNSEALQGIVFTDSQRLGLYNIENLGLIFNTEQLSNILGDVQNLGVIYLLDIENLGLSNVEALGIDFPIIAAYDTERLAAFLDVQNLGIVVYNMEELQSFIQNIEKLQDAQLFDVERLGTRLMSQDELNVVY